MEECLVKTANLCMWNAIFGVIFFICNYAMLSSFNVSAENQAFRIRCRFMESMLFQDLAWYDTNTTGDFSNIITGDLTRIKDGVGEKFGIFLSNVSATILCAGCGIYYGWKLAFVILVASPVQSIAAASLLKIVAKASAVEMEVYGGACALAEEVFSAIQTVVAFGGQKKEIQKYESCLFQAQKQGIKRGLVIAIGCGIFWLSFFSVYALAFWYGVKLFIDGQYDEKPEYTGGTIVTVFFNLMGAAAIIGKAAPFLETFAIAKGAAVKVFKIIDRIPEINSNSNFGHQPQKFSGHVHFRDVHFNYPSRPTAPVLQGVNLEAKPGETIALVGCSGCGKSTIVQLILRFYDVAEGSVELDGMDVRKLNVGWLRDRIGYVGQEPILFSTSIEENIRMGRADANQEDIERAARAANAHDFIQKLPKKYQTNVGIRGSQLSGGQKQRIAIARALIRNPDILLLDEATSSLDTQCEAAVQAALEQACKNRTTFLVAHRLSTVRSADKIIVLDQGTVKEAGTHLELLQATGIYHQLFMAQNKTNDSSKGMHTVEELQESTRLKSGVPNLDITNNTNGELSLTKTEKENSKIRIEVSNKYVKEKDKDSVEENGSSFHSPRLVYTLLQEWPYILFGSIFCVVFGITYPAVGIAFGEIIGLLSKSTEVIEESYSFWCFIFVLIAVITSGSSFLNIFLFSVAGENFTFRLRKMVFANLIYQDINFFENPKNSVGTLCTSLNSDASTIQAVTGTSLSGIVIALSAICMSIFIALFYNWKIGLVMLSFMPLSILSNALTVKITRGRMFKETESLKEAATVATEAIENIKTVASLHQEKLIYDKYRLALLDSHQKFLVQSHLKGLAYGLGDCITHFTYSATMYYGSILVANEEVELSNILKTVQAGLLTASFLANTSAFTSDYEKARIATLRIFKMLDTKPTIDAFSKSGIYQTSINGSINYSDVHFNYPSRPMQKVLRGLEFAVQQGRTVAIVGHSGSGKSTCVQLLERFYDPDKGKLFVDNVDVQSWNVTTHRSHLALVSQEPVLFSRSIAENIAYGDNNREPQMDEIIAVAKQANVHGFVTKLPQGYDTPVGARGLQMSGGQKQRIAIARALIRNPRILLLDEATSALDVESEKVVQEALDLAKRGRTCLVIAHRLSTIQNADLILVIDSGKVVEQGTHQELMCKKGLYYRLNNTQKGQS